LFVVLAIPGSGLAADRRTPAAPDAGLRRTIQLFELASVRRLFLPMTRAGADQPEGERVAALADLARLTEAVAGDPLARPLTFDELAAAAALAQGPELRATAGVARRDAAAYQLLALGYSARETADVVSGRISQRALDTARRMIAAGEGRDAAARYLDSQYTRVSAALSAILTPPPSGRPRRSTPFDAIIDQYARLHGVEVALVRAIVEAESAFNPAAVSRAGAIGLMQLMPMTARELGVNPYVPEQNIEGGVRYFAQMLQLFGGVEMALVAYNAGPGFARRYARGQTALYGETRGYVAKVLARARP
jgi:soluble lytic murein transglycosylase-like protein